MTYDQWKTDSGYSERDPREEQVDQWIDDDRAAKLIERLRSRAVIAEQENTATARSDASHFRMAADEIEKQLADGRRYRFLRDHWGTHYPMTQEQPAEWSIGWQFQ